jgi:hypothetical protein
MADEDFDLVGRVRIDTTDLGNVSSSIGASFKGMAAAAAGALAAAGVADLLRDSINEARESVKVTNLTEAALKSTGGAAKVTAAQIGDLANNISNYAGIDDEAIQGGENLLLTFKNVRNEAGKGNDVFNQATKAGVDMSVVFGQDVNSSMVQLGKALDNPIKGVTALQRVGVSFTDQQKDQIKTLTESGKTLEAQKIILGELNSQVGGAAAAAADPYQKFQVVVANLKESIGLQLLPILNDVIAWMADKLPKAVDFASGVIDTLIGGFENPDATHAFGGMEGVLLDIGATARRVFDTVKTVIGIISSLISGDIAGAGVDIGKLFGAEEDSKATGDIIKTLETVKNGIASVIGFVQENGPKLIAFFKDEVLPVVQQVGSFIADNLVPIVAGIGAALAASGVASIIGTIVEIVTTLGPAIAALISPVGLAVVAIGALVAGVIYAYQHFEGFREVVDTVVSFVQEQFSRLIAFAQEIFPQLQEAVGHVFNVIRDIVETVVGAIMGAWHIFGDNIMTYLGGVFKVVQSIIETYINVIANIIRFVLAVINGDWGKAWDAIKGIVSAVFEGIKGVISGALQAITGIIGGIYNALKLAATTAFGAITEAIKSIVGGMFNIGADIISGIIDGIKSMAGKLIDVIKSTVTDALPDFVKDALGIHSPSRVFADIGKQIPAGMVEGIVAGTNAVRDAVTAMTPTPNIAGGSYGGGLDGAAGGGLTIGEIRIYATDADSVRGVIPELIDAMRSGTGKN